MFNEQQGLLQYTPREEGNIRDEIGAAWGRRRESQIPDEAHSQAIMELEISNKKSGKSPKFWKLNNTLLSDS